jgi:LPXTG-motif cell wall-anchored protein
MLLIGAGAVLVVLGVVWSLQGVGVLGGSPMTGQQIWTVIGLILVAGGLALFVRGIRRRQRQR